MNGAQNNIEIIEFDLHSQDDINTSHRMMIFICISFILSLAFFRGLGFDQNYPYLIQIDMYTSGTYYQTEWRVRIEKLVLSVKTVRYIKWFYLCPFWCWWLWWRCYSEETAINCVKLQRVEMRLHLWINNLPLFQSFLNMLLYLYMDLHSWKTY